MTHDESESDQDENNLVDDRVIERLDEIAGRLGEVASALDDVMFDLLREASRRRIGRPPIDKTLSQARRAIDKAIHLLDVEP